MSIFLYQDHAGTNYFIELRITKDTELSDNDTIKNTKSINRKRRTRTSSATTTCCGGGEHHHHH